MAPIRSCDADQNQPESLIQRRTMRCLPVRDVILAFLFTIGFSWNASAQGNIRWAIACNGNLIQAPITVFENQGGDLNPANNVIWAGVTATCGTATLTGTLIGEAFVTPPPKSLPGRRLIFTSAIASVPLGDLTLPAKTIELFACYDFTAQGIVGPPHTFGSLVDGFYDNLGGAAKNISLAKVDYSSFDNLCPFDRVHPIAQSMQAAISVPPTVPFHDFQGGGPFAFGTLQIGSYHKFTVERDGDAVDLPSSTEASVVGVEVASAPALSVPGLLILIVLLFSAAAWVLMRRL